MGEWPGGDLEPGVPVVAHYAQIIAQRLRHALADEKVAEVAQDAGLSRSTIYDVLSGVTWPDIVTIAELERVLGTRLWPDELPAVDGGSEHAPRSRRRNQPEDDRR